LNDVTPHHARQSAELDSPLRLRRVGWSNPFENAVAVDNSGEPKMEGPGIGPTRASGSRPMTRGRLAGLTRYVTPKYRRLVLRSRQVVTDWGASRRRKTSGVVRGECHFECHCAGKKHADFTAAYRERRPTMGHRLRGEQPNRRLPSAAQGVMLRRSRASELHCGARPTRRLIDLTGSHWRAL
jgi:hypothetical protein